jgi:hypothetical protein
MFGWGQNAEMQRRAAKVALTLHIVRSELTEIGLQSMIEHRRAEGAKVVVTKDRAVVFGMSFSPTRWYDFRIDLADRNTAAISALGGGEDYGVFILAPLEDEKAWVTVKTEPGKPPGRNAKAMVRALEAEPNFESLDRAIKTVTR